MSVRTNYVLIDYESVHPEDLSSLRHDYCHVVVFVGAQQNKIAFELASALQQMGSRAEYVTIAGTGRNALDFHIAFYLGQLVQKDPDACFHIVSKDAGFDPLICYLKARNFQAVRVREIGEIPLSKTGNLKPERDRVTVILHDLDKRGPTKPRTVATLTSTIGALFHKQLSPEEVSDLVKELHENGYVSISGNKVSYSLPD